MKLRVRSSGNATSTKAKPTVVLLAVLFAGVALITGTEVQKTRAAANGPVEDFPALWPA